MGWAQAGAWGEGNLHPANPVVAPPRSSCQSDAQGLALPRAHPGRAPSPTWTSIVLLLGSYLDWNFSGCIMTSLPGEAFKNFAISVLKVW